MSEDSAAVAKRHHGVSKFLSKDRWREKLANNLTGSSASPEPHAPGEFTLSDDVNDFLRPSTSKARPVSPKAPRIGIDVAAAQRWASDAASSAAGHSLPTPSIMRKKDYPRRALNLVVQFSNTMPEIIGEGGDDSDEPVIEIAKRLEQSGRRRPRPLLPPRPITAPDTAQPVVHELPRTHELEVQTAAPELAARQLLSDLDHLQEPVHLSEQSRNNSFPTDEPDFVPKPIKRTQTRFSDLGDDENGNGSSSENARPSVDSGSVRSTRSGSEPGQVASPASRSTSYRQQALQSTLDGSPLQLRTTRLEDLHFGGKRNSLSSPTFQEKISRMRAEEGQALHSAVEKDPFLDQFDTSNEPVSDQSAAGETTTQRSMSQGRPSLQLGQNPSSAAATLNVQSQFSQVPSPSLSVAEPTPSVQPHTTIPPRKPIVPSPVDVQLRPAPSDPDQGPAPRVSPALNVTIPNRLDYSQTSNSSPPSRGSESAVGYVPLATAAATSSSSTPGSITPNTASSLRPPTNATPNAALGQIALDDFADRCSHMSGIFRLQAEFERPMYEFTPLQWLRAAVWWFLRGRLGVESLVRSKPRSIDGRTDFVHGQELLSQPHVDLAKAWWILVELIPSHPQLPASETADYAERSMEARNAADLATAELFESCDVLMSNLKSVLASMKRNGVMPPTHALIQGQDQTIWIKYPELSAALHPILSGLNGRALTEVVNIPKFSPLSVMAVTDTRLDFSYNRCFVNAMLGTGDPDIERIPLPAVVSVMRERNDWHPKLTICTQRELVTICIQGDRKRGPSWQDVKWSESSRSLHVGLPHGYSLSVQLNEPDFRQLFNLYNHTFRVQSSLLPLANERIVYETSLVDFQYKDSRQPPAFPPDRVKRCRIRIFAKTETKYEGSGERKIYRGFRVLAVTSPKNRILGSASHDVGLRYPTLVAAVKDTANPSLPAQTLYVQEDRRQCSLLMVFGNEQDSRMLLDTLNSFVLVQGETQVAAVRLKSLNIESSDQADAFSGSSKNPFAKMHWREVLTLSKNQETPGSGFESLGPSDSLRVVAQAGEGTLTDRVDVGPGELKLRLSPDGKPDLTILRGAQESLSITLDPSQVPPQLPVDLADIQRTAFMLPTLRTLSFFSLEDLHAFQASITSFHVTYDGLAQTFTIARRRPVTALSRHKKLEAGTSRIQVVSHERQRIVQLLAFFDDMPQADCLNFQLKGVDQFERYEDKHAKGRYGVKLVDAKFTLPIKEKPDKEDRGSRSDTPDNGGTKFANLEKKFVSLDALEPPAENDDIFVGFESEQERERFLQALPAPPQAHKGLTIRRRI
ncbi:uncharacterized protein PV09_08699 [Verruconis gallopava]|uniref:Uncharacterized protein n=1 Tax=Verruconis gallopava TaxID=253628 RepID=A0A0D2A009_9PEZI|nr:uncharacterized protein PV09_08699 [Verruconis gallopava]KIV99634.1 hypothetical protein PV09_08699 [Verruconis gallopava]